MSTPLLDGGRLLRSDHFREIRMRKAVLLGVVTLVLGVVQTAPALGSTGESLPAARTSTSKVTSHPTHHACTRSTKKDVASCHAIVRDDVATPKSAITPNATPSGLGPSHQPRIQFYPTVNGPRVEVDDVDVH
jgi:hypothetical protein